MEAIWAKITAFFMSIIAFFIGLFPGCETPPTEPEQPVLTQHYDIPVLPNVNEPAAYQSSGSTQVFRFEDCTEADFDAYVQLLCENGYTVYDAHPIENNRFATLTGQDLTIHLSWYAGTQTMRAVCELPDTLCPLTDPYTAQYETLLTGMKGETVVAAEGMGFIIRLADGSFCIIDGGMGDPNHVDADKLM